jgi:uncharacterized OB-fold protein
LPDTDWDETREFWAAAARGELAVPRCADCRKRVWYPRPTCPDCERADLRWEPVSGRATLFSWAVVTRALFKPFAEKAPYITGLVALEEDPSVRIVTNLVDCEPDDLRMDMPVRVVFRDLEFPESDDRVPAPFFTPVARNGRGGGS